MSDCQQLDPLLTPYADGELGPADKGAVEAHVQRCPPCAARVRTEQSVRTLLQARRSALCRETAPASLRARCAAPIAPPVVRFTRAWRQRVGSFALAASLVLVVAGAFLYQATARSSRVLAAELTADHLKCFMIGPTGVGEAGTDRVLTSKFDWHARLPSAADAGQQGLELVGARLCLYGQGRVAHIMYRHNGRPVSVFMLPDTTRASALTDALGHEAAIWTIGHRTFVLISKEPSDQVQELATFMRAELR